MCRLLALGDNEFEGALTALLVSGIVLATCESLCLGIVSVRLKTSRYRSYFNIE